MSTEVHAAVVRGDDGLTRCLWGSRDPELRRYHDEEWGSPLHGERPLYEKLCLEGFQAGLSWLTILKRRPHFRGVFHDFDVDRVAQMTTDDVERLLADTGIIRNRAKILATIGNARATIALRSESEGDETGGERHGTSGARNRGTGGDGALDGLMWSFAPPPHSEDDRPRQGSDIPVVTPESDALSRELRRRGFRFVGPTTVYALMQSAGMVDDHLVGCFRAAT